MRFAFRIYDMDNDGFISNGELFQVLKMMVGNNLKDTQLQQIVDKTILFADKDEDGKISFEEFCSVSKEIELHRAMSDRSCAHLLGESQIAHKLKLTSNITEHSCARLETIFEGFFILIYKILRFHS